MDGSLCDPLIDMTTELPTYGLNSPSVHHSFLQGRDMDGTPYPSERFIIEAFGNQNN